MRVAINRSLEVVKKPPVNFSRKLFEHLRAHGVKVVPPHRKPDIYFAIISFNKRDVPPGAKIVQRVDGIYWNLKDKDRRMNQGIFNSIRRADGVVFQSNFCLNCCLANGAKPREHTVILNGTNQDFIHKLTPATLPKTPGIVACAIWRPTKRPGSICNGFLASRIPHHLYMIGRPPRKGMVIHPRITWLGQLDEKRAISHMKACSHAIHLAKFDPCSSAVAEEVSCGLPVLHTANGGTPEIVKGQGIEMDVDRVWDYQQIKCKIDNVDARLTATHLEQLVQMPRFDQPREDLEMTYAAKRYFEFFNKVLSS